MHALGMDDALPPPLLQIGFLAQTWGLENVMPEAHFFDVTRMHRLILVHNVFSRSITKTGKQNLTRAERKIMAEVMMLRDD